MQTGKQKNKPYSAVIQYIVGYTKQYQNKNSVNNVFFPIFPFSFFFKPKTIEE